MFQKRNSPKGRPERIAGAGSALIERPDPADEHVRARVAGAFRIVHAEPQLAGLEVLEVLLLPATLDSKAELQAVRADQFGQLVAELQRIVVGVHVVGLRPQVADLAAAAPAVEQVGREIRAGLRRREDAAEVDPSGALHEHAGILEVIVQRQPAPADQYLVGHRRAQHRHDVAGDRPAAVLADVRGRQRDDVLRRPPHTARALGRLALARDPDVGLGAVADVPVEARLEVEAVVRLQLAVDVVIEVGGSL